VPNREILRMNHHGRCHLSFLLNNKIHIYSNILTGICQWNVLFCNTECKFLECRSNRFSLFQIRNREFYYLSCLIHESSYYWCAIYKVQHTSSANFHFHNLNTASLSKKKHFHTAKPKPNTIMGLTFEDGSGTGPTMLLGHSSQQAG